MAVFLYGESVRKRERERVSMVYPPLDEDKCPVLPRLHVIKLRCLYFHSFPLPSPHVLCFFSLGVSTLVQRAETMMHNKIFSPMHLGYVWNLCFKFLGVM